MKLNSTTSVVTVRIGNELNQELERYATQTNNTKTEVILESIRAFLTAKSAHKYNDQMIETSWEETDWGNLKSIYSLSDDERRRLILLEQIARSNPNTECDEEDHERAIVALRNGYTCEYEDVLPGIFPELPNTATNEAQEIMEMFLTLQNSYEVLPAKDKKNIDKRTLPFIHCQGFDFNDSYEVSIFNYLKFIRQEDRWVVPFDDMLEHSDRGNSHSPCINFYRSMLTRYKSISRRHLGKITPLSAKEITDIINIPSGQ